MIIENLADMIEKGLRLIHSSHNAFVIDELEELNVADDNDCMHSCVFFNGKPVHLCIKATSKKGCIEVYDLAEKRVKTLHGDVKILRWALIARKGDMVGPL